MKILTFVVVASVVGMGGAAYAQTYYRWVDADGNVTYSANAPQDAQQVAPVEVQPGPGDEEVQRALERQRRFEAQLEEAQAKRGETELSRDGKIKAAEEAVVQAEEDLLNAKKTSGADYLSGGGLTDYRQRVQAAQEALDKAKQELRNARTGRQ
jgi:hypothetical protein